MKKSKDFYVKISGDYALWTSVFSKGGGERISYSVPTRQGIHGILDALYFKPTFLNVVERVKVISPINTETKGIRATVGKNKLDLNYVTYLVDPIYLVKFHFVWNDIREDLSHDRDYKKHEAIMERSLKKGGRRDIFMGTRECVAYAEIITESDYLNTKTAYEDQTLSFGLMFNSFTYPKMSGQPLISNFANITMKNGEIIYPSDNDCDISYELSNYTFNYSEGIKSVVDEFREL
ncbi:type I-C CRISPR-associated protein Cas5c [Macrococcus capreoli]